MLGSVDLFFQRLLGQDYCTACPSISRRLRIVSGGKKSNEVCLQVSFSESGANETILEAMTSRHKRRSSQQSIDFPCAPLRPQEASKFSPLLNCEGFACVGKKIFFSCPKATPTHAPSGSRPLSYGTQYGCIIGNEEARHPYPLKNCIIPPLPPNPTGSLPGSGRRISLVTLQQDVLPQTTFFREEVAAKESSLCSVNANVPFPQKDPFRMLW